MATVELIKAAGTYDVTAITWSPIQLIPEIGITQLKIYYALNNDTVWTELTKNSWKSTFNGTAQTISLLNATYTLDGSEVPAYVNPSLHKIKIKRVTSPTLYITFTDGAKLSGRDLNIVNLQAIHLLEEEAARLDTADADIYTYINTSLNNYYTKTEIDQSLNNLGLVVSWAVGETYIQGDVVKHNDPNTEDNKDLVWYCIVSNVGTLQNQPTETGIGSTFWSQQKSTALNSLSYIRKLPGATGEELDWNTIKISNGDSPALKIITNINQAVDVLSVVDYNNNPLLNFTSDNFIITDDDVSLWLKGEVYSSGNNWINYTPNQNTIGNPVFSIKGRTNESAIEVVKSTASDNNSNVLFKLNDNSLTTNFRNQYIDGGIVEFINKVVWFSNREEQNCWGNLYENNNGEFPFTEVRFGRDIKLGTLASCDSPFVPTLSLSATTGNIGTIGNITTSGTLSADELVLPYITEANYLSTDINGKVISGSGSPATNRIIISVTGSNTALSNRDVVYLNNDTGLWTKSQANDKLTLAVGVVDNVSGVAPNQSFSVVFSGVVTGYTGLEIGNWYWLSKNTAGAMISTRPSDPGDLIDPVGIAISSTSLFVITSRAHKLPTGESSPGGPGVPGSGDVKTDTIWDSKGDLAVGTGENSAQRLPIGSNGQYLVADSTQTLGVKWASLASSFDFGTLISPADFTLDLGGI